jgi:hypothetical protein
MALVALLLLLPRLTFAECIGNRLHLLADHASVVFSGTVVRISANTASAWGGQIITFDVDRVWKGAPTKQSVIYSFTRTPDRFEFTVGEEYVVFAHIQTTEERTEFGMIASEKPTFGVGQCGDGTIRYKLVEVGIADLGPGRPPSP